MSSVLHNCALAGLAALGLAWSGPAAALDPPGGKMQPLPPDSVLNGVVVHPPKTIQRDRMGMILQLMTMSVHVPYRDLDMSTPTGVAELDKRVSEAARYICRQLEILYPNGSPDSFYCAKEAVSDAQPQVVAARVSG